MTIRVFHEILTVSFWNEMLDLIFALAVRPLQKLAHLHFWEAASIPSASPLFGFRVLN